MMDNRHDPAHPVRKVCTGLTKREYAAIQIMAGLAADPNTTCNEQIAAKVAREWADALFDELDKTF